MNISDAVVEIRNAVSLAWANAGEGSNRLIFDGGRIKFAAFKGERIAIARVVHTGDEAFAHKDGDVFVAELTVELYNPVPGDPTPGYALLDTMRQSLSLNGITLLGTAIEEVGNVGNDRDGEWFEIDLVQELFYSA